MQMGFVDNIIAKCKYLVHCIIILNLLWKISLTSLIIPLLNLLPRGYCYGISCIVFFNQLTTFVEFHFLQSTCFWYLFIPDIATVFGYLVVSRPFLNLAHPRHLNSSHSERLEVCITSLYQLRYSYMSITYRMLKRDSWVTEYR